MTNKSNLIQICLIGSSSKCSLPPSSSRAQLINLNFFQARAELSSKIQNLFKPELSQAWILTLPPSRAQPAQLELFGSSQLKLGPARYTLNMTFPACNIFQPTVFKRQLCFRLDLSQLLLHKREVFQGKESGLMLVLDTNADRSLNRANQI